MIDSGSLVKILIYKLFLLKPASLAILSNGKNQKIVIESHEFATSRYVLVA